MWKVWVVALVCVCATGRVTAAQSSAAMTPGHTELAAADLKWMPAPPVLPKGVEIAVLTGNPFAEGFSIVRLKIPPHTVIAPHWHPTAENFTVLRGTLFAGKGDAVDKHMARAIAAMGFASMPALAHHYAYTEGEAVVLDLSFYGPFQIQYVHPADDPSKPSSPRR
jgi:hypothetical protein